MFDQDSSPRQTKIVATLGPATSQPEALAEILNKGVNVVRLNCSHGTHEDHKARIDLVREQAEKLGLVIGIIADLQGPKIRVARFVEGKVTLENGATFILDAAMDADSGTAECVGIDYKDLPKDVQPNDILLLDDGRICARVTAVEGEKIITEVEVGGVLSNHKGINRKGGGLSARALTEKDKADLAFAVSMDVDWIAVSFPRSAEDINETRDLIKQHNGDSGIIAKIERSEAIGAIDEIIEASDGVMVARGDLAVEIGDAEVPLVQKHIITRARSLDKPVIIATQMMESMIHSTVPTRAEVSDVANAVLDNADAVMLSAESAVGDNPGIVVEAMARVCEVSERMPHDYIADRRAERRAQSIPEAIALSTMYTANHLNIKAVVALTESGATTLWMSRIRTNMPIYGLSRFKRALGKMALYRGVHPVPFDVTQFTRAEINKKTIDFLHEKNVLDSGDRVILTKGDHLGVGGGSNAMKILVVGQVL